jgi:molecular chaperone GrpE (heat shock protein)
VDTPWVAIVFAVFAGLVGVIYFTLVKRDESTDKKLSNHINEDIQAHERIAKLETKVERAEDEIEGIRERWHNFRNGTLKDYAEIAVEKAKKLLGRDEG